MIDENELKTRSPIQDLRQFLHENVATYEELEALLLLQREPQVARSISAVAQSLGLPVELCRVALETLAARGLLALGGDPVTFSYSPANKQLAYAAEQLQRAYSNDRFAIVQLMTTNAMDRVKKAALDRLGGSLQLKKSR